MKFTVLGSGSTGNAVLISSDRTNVLVDAGLSAKEILRRLGEVGVSKDDLDGILITHEHSDHAGGLRPRRLRVSRATRTRNSGSAISILSLSACPTMRWIILGL